MLITLVIFFIRALIPEEHLHIYDRLVKLNRYTLLYISFSYFLDEFSCEGCIFYIGTKGGGDMGSKFKNLRPSDEIYWFL